MLNLNRWLGLQAEIRLHEAGIASNRRSAYYGECVPEPCTHRPSSHESWGARSRDVNRLRRLVPKGNSMIGTKS